MTADGAAPGDRASLLPPQGPAARRASRCTTTTATPRCSPTCRPATGRRAGGSSRRATRRSARRRGGHPRVLRQALDRRRIAIRQAQRRLQQQRRAERPPVHPDELHRQAARRDDAGPRAGPRPASVPVAAGRLLPVRHAADDGGDGQRLRRDADVPPLAGAVPGAADAAGHAVQQDRGRLRHGLPPGGADALRAGAAQGPPRAGRIDDGADQRTLDGGQPADARRGGAADGRLRLVVALHRPFHPLAVLLLRLRLRRTAGAGAGADVPAGGRGVRAASTWSCWRRAARTRRTCCWRGSAWT